MNVRGIIVKMLGTDICELALCAAVAGPIVLDSSLLSSIGQYTLSIYKYSDQTLTLDLLCKRFYHSVIAIIDPKQPNGDALKNESSDLFSTRAISFLQMCKFQVPDDATGYEV